MAIASAIVIYNNGTEVALSKGSGNTWSATFPAPAQSSGSNNNGEGPGVGSAAQGLGYYPVAIKATDDAGNVTTITTSDSTYGNVLKLKVLEKTKPVATITYPTQGALITNAKPEIAFTITDSGSGVNAGEVYIKIDSGNATKATVTGSGTTFSGTFTPGTALAEGEHTITVYGKDYDGNQSANATVTFKIDTVPPSLNVTSPVNNSKTNQASCTVAGTTNDTTSSPVVITITLGSQSYTPTVGSGGAFSQAVTLSEGSNTITIKATDAAGKVTTVTRTVTLDTSPPVITDITMTPNPVDGGQTVTVQVTITD